MTVGMILGQIGAGHSIEEVLTEYAYLEREDVHEAAGGHESVAEVGRRVPRIGMGSGAPVGVRPSHGARFRDMAYAAANAYVVVTHDLDFSAIRTVTHGNKPSVVQIRSDDMSAEIIGKRTVMALRHLQDELETGVLLTIEADRTRLRLLPLKIAEQG